MFPSFGECAALVSGAAVVAALARMRYHLGRLETLPGAGGAARTESVCLCIPARNEAREVGPAVESWLAQDFPGLSIVAVDDGSTDATPAILAALARAHPGRLEVVRNDVLPPGWLGKNHALHLAVQREAALGAQWLLFVDANVKASPDLLARTFAYLDTHPADILALTFRVDGVGLAERLFALMLWPFGFILMPPHQVPNPRHRTYCGAGGFTLVTRRAYDAVGGHAGAPLEAIDDVMLAGRVKHAGFVNRVAQGSPMLNLRMYHGLMDLLRSSRKSFASAEGWLLPVLIPLVLFGFLTPLGLASTGHPWLGLAVWLAAVVAGADADHRLNDRGFDPAWLAWPLMGPLAAWGMAWAFLDWLRGRNTWRGRTVDVLDGEAEDVPAWMRRLATGFRDPRVGRNLVRAMGLVALAAVGFIVLGLAAVQAFFSPLGGGNGWVLLPLAILALAPGAWHFWTTHGRGSSYRRGTRNLVAAAEAGEPEACFRLAEAYATGDSELPCDPPSARHWLERAAQGGHRDAMVRLAEILLSGHGAQVDIPSAKKWLFQARALGHPRATALLARLSSPAGR